MELNQLANPNLIRVRQVLLIDAPSVGRAEEPVVPRSTDRSVYVVRPGDTLSGIAALLNTTVQKLQKKNRIRNPNRIRVGQKIKV